MAPADRIPRKLVPRSPPTPLLSLLPTRPPRQPAPYASDTLPGVTPPSGPCLISVCIQPSPRARRSVDVVERDGSRFPRPDPPPWWGRRGSGTFSTSRECPPSVTPTPYPRPFRPLSMLPWWTWHRSSWDPVDSPLVRNLASLVPLPCLSSGGNCRPGRPLLFTLRCLKNHGNCSFVPRVRSNVMS